ncbi:Uncharacterised protein [Avibacterium paragallinarum]|uniref:Uncharacterized protein n=1 Tax=Avibacterium paragallinarum TaxID=728 RepID=A0A377I642_AVIPA|nr:Uncharacterised protein [Avibacterium paragallinarum]
MNIHDFTPHLKNKARIIRALLINDKVDLMEPQDLVDA